VTGTFRLVEIESLVLREVVRRSHEHRISVGNNHPPSAHLKFMLLDFPGTPKLSTAPWPERVRAQPGLLVSQTLHRVHLGSACGWHRSEKNTHNRGDEDGHDRGKSRDWDAVIGKEPYREGQRQSDYDPA
jgi:hypothetical protein